MKSILITALSVLAFGSLAVAAEKKDIVDTAVDNGSFKTLAAALEAAGLVDALKGDGPFTVFAPTDEAFAKLPEGTVETLLKPENKDQLVDILTYHVVSGKVLAKTAVTLDKATALNKKDIALAVKDGSLTLNGSAKVVTADVEATNGVIHVIDAVILPPKGDDKASMKSSPARDLVELAIKRGVPHYNHGNHQACAAIYEVAAHALMSMPEGTVSDDDRRMLSRAIAATNHSHCMTTNAWTFRRAFDEMMVAAR